jgi:collagen type XII alpha
VPPKDLSFSEVTSYSFKTNWSPAGENVFSYHISYKEATGDDEVTVVEPASSTSVILDNLKPETQYLVNVTAEYEDGFSIPLAGEETTDESMIGCYYSFSKISVTKFHFVITICCIV